MSGSSWLDWDIEASFRRERSLEDRASLAFKVVAALNVPGIVLAPWGTPPSFLLATTSVGATILVTILYVLEARALDRRRRWARLAARPLLAVLVVFGIYSAIVAFGEGWLKVPFDVAFGAWAWLSYPGIGPGEATDLAVVPGPETRPGLRAVSVVLLVAVLEAAIWYGRPVFGWGGLLDAHQRDLSATLQVDCGPPGGGPPATLTVRYDWSWRIRPPFPSGLDVVVIGWRGVDGLGRTLYLLGDTPVTGPGIQPSFQDVPSLDMASDIETRTPGSWHWGIHLGRQAYDAGHIEFQLGLARDAPPQPGPMTFTATYVHLGIWNQASPSVTCRW